MAAARHITATAASASVDDYETLTHLSSYSLPSAMGAAAPYGARIAGGFFFISYDFVTTISRR